MLPQLVLISPIDVYSMVELAWSCHNTTPSNGARVLARLAAFETGRLFGRLLATRPVTAALLLSAPANKDTEPKFSMEVMVAACTSRGFPLIWYPRFG